MGLEGFMQPPSPTRARFVVLTLLVAAAAAVPLSSVRQPRQDLGRRAAELLLDEVGDPDHQHEQVVFTPELVARASTLGRP